jgi:hypothetical protein
LIAYYHRKQDLSVPELQHQAVIFANSRCGEKPGGAKPSLRISERAVLRVSEGTVTLIEICRSNDRGRNGSRCNCRLTPCQHSLIAKHAQGSAGGQMALDIEYIVDGGVD